MATEAEQSPPPERKIDRTLTLEDATTSWVEYGLQQARLLQDAFQYNLDALIERYRSRLYQIVSTSSDQLRYTLSMLSRAEAKVQELRKSIDQLKAESEKLERDAKIAEEIMIHGRTKLRQAGKQIQGVIWSAYKIESQAQGLKDVLDELPQREASRFKSQVSIMALEAKQERSVLSKEISKISNYGISV